MKSINYYDIKQVMRLPLTSLFLLCLPGLSLAGGMSDGGGNAVVCFDSPSLVTKIRQEEKGLIPNSAISHITMIKAYDLFEAELPTGLKGETSQLIPLQKSESAADYVKKIARRFEFVVPTITNIIRESRRDFSEDRIVNQPNGVIAVNDIAASGLIDTENCVLATMAVQSKTGDMHYLSLDSRLFNHRLHSELSRAVLLLHEYIYKYARETLKQSDSRNTRRLVKLAISQNDGRTAQALAREMINLGFLPQLKTLSIEDSANYWTYPGRAMLQLTYWLMMSATAREFFSSSAEYTYAWEVQEFFKKEWAISFACPEFAITGTSVKSVLLYKCKQAVVDFVENNFFEGKPHNYPVSEAQKTQALQLANRLQSYIDSDRKAAVKNDMDFVYQRDFSAGLQSLPYLSENQIAQLKKYSEELKAYLLQVSTNDFIVSLGENCAEENSCAYANETRYKYLNPYSGDAFRYFAWKLLRNPEAIALTIPSEQQIIRVDADSEVQINID